MIGEGGRRVCGGWGGVGVVWHRIRYGTAEFAIGSIGCILEKIKSYRPGRRRGVTRVCTGDSGGVGEGTGGLRVQGYLQWCRAVSHRNRCGSKYLEVRVGSSLGCDMGL